MTSLTLLTLLVAVIGVLSRRGYGLALALGGVTAAGAAIQAGAIAVPTFYAIAIGALVALVLDLLRAGRSSLPLPPAVALLLALLGWGALVTVIAPVLFPGLQTITPSNAVLEPGVLTSSNIAQIVYLGLGICVVVVIARDPRAGVELIGITVGLGMLLSLWKYGNTIVGLPFPTGLFDNSTSLQYIDTAAGGVARFRGIFSEPAALASTALVMIAYGASRLWQVRGLRRIGLIALMIVSVYLGVVSTSTTFIVAGVGIVLVALVTFVFGFLSRVTRLNASLGVAACFLVLLAVWLLPVVADFVQTAITAKVGNASFTQRSGSDASSYAVFVRTWGLGVGLGSGRGSSLLPTVLSTSGLIGTLLLTAAIVALVVRTMALKPYRPAIWALAATLAAKLVAGPDLADPSGVLWVSLGLLAGAAMRAGEPAPVVDSADAGAIAAGRHAPERSEPSAG